MQRRGEMLERPFAHCLETGGLRRVHLRGRENIEKRYQLHVAGYSLGVLMRTLTGMGTPRGLQGLTAALTRAAKAVIAGTCSKLIAWTSMAPSAPEHRWALEA